jgi:hypothetical protein
VCQGRLLPHGEVISGRFEQSQPVAVDLPDTPVVEEQVDVPDNS